MDDRFISHPSSAAGQWSLSSDRSGFGFDRMWVHGGLNRPDPGSLGRDGLPLAHRMGTCRLPAGARVGAWAVVGLKPPGPLPAGRMDMLKSWASRGLNGRWATRL